MHEIVLASRRLKTHAGTTLASMAALACAIGAGAVTWAALSA